MGDSLKTRETKGLTVDPVSNVHPTVGDSPSGPHDSPDAGSHAPTADEERRAWEQKRTAAAADARGAFAEGEEGDEDGGERQSAQAAGANGGRPTAGPEAPLAAPPPGPHPLESGWAIWEHRAADSRTAARSQAAYEQNMAKLIEFSTVEDFWRAWNNVPKPSAIFFDGKANKKVGDRVIESLSLFKAGIRPEWEDKMNRQGGEWFIRKAIPLPYLDDVWTKLALGMIGETLDNGADSDVTGARVVDKSVRHKPMYRLELWFKSKAAMDKLKEALQNVFNDPKKPLVWEFRSHS
ncbi:hypothetical protein KFE25_000999 [Diacronema lutheri]|uniref:Eukaryotic translation initiation factor 4E n=2 Tax=Diacronema lutheri TaxID=2081491 RepID=A0A8J5XA76_DIALT|nr:hypothetical protein KFE25_000999 [Diacronema lutheri]